MKFLKALLLAMVMLEGVVVQAQEVMLQQRKYTPAFQKGTVRTFLEDIQKQTGIELSYSDKLVKRRRQVQLNGTEHTVGEVLHTILSDTKVSITERSGKILLVPDEGTGKPIPVSPITISGIVKDSSSKEVLIGAACYIPSLKIGATTNAYGFYSLSLPPGDYTVITASGGYKADTSKLHVEKNLRRDVLLSNGRALDAVTVQGNKTTRLDHAHLTMKDITQHAGLLGENDVLRALQYIPGVQTGMDGTSSTLVRGGDPGQNLNLLDGVPLYYIDHFYGLTSVFNTDAVKSVDFYKGAFPSRYGGRLSSIIDVSSRDGDMEQIGGQASLGLVKGSLMLEGPIVKDKASVMVSARRTWIDALWRPFFDEIGFDIYDINAKANYIINKNNRVYASFYTGRDNFRLEVDNSNTQAKWGNTISAARWTSIINPRLFINTTATYSYFRYEILDKDVSILPDSFGNRPDYIGKSFIRDVALRVQADYYMSAKHKLQAGMHYANAFFSPATSTYGGNYRGGFNNTVSATSFHSHEMILYGEDEFRPSTKWMIRGGLHFANWLNADYYYSTLQPRLYAKWTPNERNSVWGSLTKMSQFLHLLTSNTSGLPADFWIPSTARLEPELSWLYAVGYKRQITKKLEGTAEVYYKDIRHLVTYKGAANIFENSQRWEDKLTQGRGYAYGAEFLLRSKTGPLTATAIYTLSWAWRQFDALNDGKAFPYRYDRRHNFKAELFYQRSKRFSAIISWSYMTGEAITLPDQIYPDFDSNLPGGGYSGYLETYNYSARNNYRLPDIHRLDMAVNFMRQRGRRFERTWTIGLFNAYANNNIIAVKLEKNEWGNFVLNGFSLFKVMPTINYSVKF